MPEPVIVHGRRTILAAAAGGVAAATASLLTRSLPANADDGDIVVVGHGYVSATQTTINKTTSNGAAIRGTASAASGNARGLYGEGDGASGVGVEGYAGSDTGATTGVKGQSTSQTGAGVYGQSDSDLAIYGYNTNSGTSILGYGQGGTGVRGHTTGSSAPAIVGHAYGTPTGVAGISGPGDDPVLPINTGVYGVASRNAGSAGVRGESTTGRGGVFKGNVAQLRFIPSLATTHPSSGQLGDLFLDKNKRLWFCKGGTSWRQIV